MSNLIDRLFAEHPRSVGETYPEHFGIACRFGAAMILAGLACFVHALFPKLFERTGSSAIKRLYEKLMARQPGSAPLAHEEPNWRPEYEI
jgi:hypothetical protein